VQTTGVLESDNCTVAGDDHEAVYAVAGVVAEASMTMRREGVAW